ncbi:MAG TPA: phosphatase PAP2 family protein [Allosphingosinicella sp.]|nr:phosphatase PAP2 family protein [Allosphingosinicella sp.]
MAKNKDKTPLDETADALLDADEAVAEAVEPYSDASPVEAVGWLSEIGDQPQMRILCGAVIAAGLVGGSKRLTRAGLRMIAAHTLATEAKDVIKKRVDRKRPRSRDGKDGHKPRAGKSTSKEVTSFPSGHSAGAAAVASAYAREFPEHRAAAVAGAGAIALAQIPRCAHYPTDVGVGLALGLVADALLDPVLDPLFEALQLSGDELDE